MEKKHLLSAALLASCYAFRGVPGTRCRKNAKADIFREPEFLEKAMHLRYTGFQRQLNSGGTVNTDYINCSLFNVILMHNNLLNFYTVPSPPLGIFFPSFVFLPDPVGTRHRSMWPSPRSLLMPGRAHMISLFRRTHAPAWRPALPSSPSCFHAVSCIYCIYVLSCAVDDTLFVYTTTVGYREA